MKKWVHSANFHNIMLNCMFRVTGIYYIFIAFYCIITVIVLRCKVKKL